MAGRRWIKRANRDRDKRMDLFPRHTSIFVDPHDQSRYLLVHDDPRVGIIDIETGPTAQRDLEIKSVISQYGTPRDFTRSIPKDEGLRQTYELALQELSTRRIGAKDWTARPLTYAEKVAQAKARLEDDPSLTDPDPAAVAARDRQALKEKREEWSKLRDTLNKNPDHPNARTMQLELENLTAGIIHLAGAVERHDHPDRDPQVTESPQDRVARTQANLNEKRQLFSEATAAVENTPLSQVSESTAQAVQDSYAVMQEEVVNAYAEARRARIDAGMDPDPDLPDFGSDPDMGAEPSPPSPSQGPSSAAIEPDVTAPDSGPGTSDTQAAVTPDPEPPMPPPDHHPMDRRQDPALSETGYYATTSPNAYADRIAQQREALALRGEDVTPLLNAERALRDMPHPGHLANEAERMVREESYQAALAARGSKSAKSSPSARSGKRSGKGLGR